ncbi:N-terminal domain of NEFA-interacting nuclear protein NIP30 [Musa troglodytarum]|uniref:N-terminal domain of NEFA-interacting nuclear protein NIP30 n=2 Tax=Musa troglodytarum TaxID=320322 RepID=A0A9E7GP85_9LILI|nr:N-terminal domain of NEFA-interacting nuclear protein NIP30 [Musa troglodytarum]
MTRLSFSVDYWIMAAHLIVPLVPHCNFSKHLRGQIGLRRRKQRRKEREAARTMEDEPAAPPLRLVNFVSEEQLVHAKRTRGERVEDGTAQRDRPLYEILKENKEKKDAEFNERFKHRPPKALDEDETEFLDKLETSRREYEQQVAFEDAQQLRSFHEAVAAQSSIVRELKETTPVARTEVSKPLPKRNQQARSGNLVIAVKSQAKKARTEATVPDGFSESSKPPDGGLDAKPPPDVVPSALGGLVSYSDESEEDD